MKLLIERGLPGITKLWDGSVQVDDRVFRFLAKSDDVFQFDHFHEEEERHILYCYIY